MSRIVALGVVLVIGVAAVAALKAETASKQALFERAFGSYARFDPAIVARVKALKPGTRYYVDRAPGRPAEMWFIDTDQRHQKAFQPILVRVIDEDGNLANGGDPDCDNDLYLADWRADGTVDAAVDYRDDDGDGDADAMGLFFFQPNHRYMGKDALCVWWGIDIGDDNRLWYDVNWTYQQPDCQWRTHFGGDEMFCQFALTQGAERWEPVFENPFLFYDTDRDGESEVVIRLSGKGDQIECLRYSFDADNRSSPAVPHHYDGSLSALAPGCTLGTKDHVPGQSDLRLPPRYCTTTTIRGIPTGPFAAHDRAAEFCNTTRWARVLLTWDENDLNTDNQWEKDSHLRWEGVIAHPSKNFPQIGGPTCGPFNKRNEIDLAPAGPMRLYYDPADRRIHLRDADEAWIDVDYNQDRKADMRYTYRDTDGDGVLDTREIDIDADGKEDLVLKCARPAVEGIPLNWGMIADVYRPALDAAVAENQAIIDGMKAVLMARDAGFTPDAVETFYAEKLGGWLPEQRVGERMRASQTAGRYYQDLVRDRYYVRLRKILPDGQEAATLHELYAAGQFAAASKLLHKMFASSLPPPPAGPEPPGGDVRGRPGIRLRNARGLLRENELIVVPVEQIRKVAPDFDPRRVAVVDGNRVLDWRRIPHQVDAAGPGGREELCFIASVDPRAARTYWLAAAPKGESKPPFADRTATAQDWVPPNIGWESEQICYRAYWGQFDFFGKKVERLILPTIGNKSYHDEVEWGIDALNVKSTSGLGGITLYVGDREYLVQNPEGKGTVEFAKRAVASGPVRTTVEIVGDKVGPYKVQIRCVAIAGRQETQISALVTGPATNEPVCIAPGFTRLDVERMIVDDAAGVFATWGSQTTVIGTVGFGLVFDPQAFAGLVETPAEHKIRLRAQVGRETTYLIVGDWLRGRRYPRCPTIENWHRELKYLAVRFRNPIGVEVMPPAATK